MKPHVMLIVLAFAMDACIGDPVYPFHPVRLMGKFIQYAASIFLHKDWSKKATGAFTAFSLIFFSAYPAYLLLSLLKGSYWGFIIEVLLIYTTISMRDLYNHSDRILHALSRGNIEEARRRVGMIVGRDTDELDEEGIARAAIESVAENLVDGVISPLFFACLGGAPLALAFKAISTLDSMIGYKNDKYRDFGMLGARLDDAANYIPARLSLLLIPLASMVTGHNAWQSFKTGLKDRRKSPSPNSGFSEACMAGALEIRLGGSASYAGKLKEKPYLGKSTRPIIATQIIDSNVIAATTSVIYILFFAFITNIIQ